jgi:propanediol dehydratase small subunit
MTFDPTRDYPIGLRRPELVTTLAGTPLEDVTLASARAGALAADEIRASPETLSRQADVARAAGRPQLAENLLRAAELAAVPDEELLEIYTALRPGRSNAADLETWAERLEKWAAPRTAAFVREAAEAYAARGLLGD